MAHYYITSDTDDNHALLLVAQNDAVAAAAVCAISGRSMGLLREDGGFVMPHNLTKETFGLWLLAEFKVDNADALINGVERAKLADALDTFFVGTRAEYHAKEREWSGYKPDIRAELRKAWDEARNGGVPVSTAQVAWAIAAKLREPEPAPAKAEETRPKEIDAAPSQ